MTDRLAGDLCLLNPLTAEHLQDLSGGPALLYGVGAEDERYASEQTNVQRGQFIKGDARLFSAAVAYAEA